MVVGLTVVEYQEAASKEAETTVMVVCVKAVAAEEMELGATVEEMGVDAVAGAAMGPVMAELRVAAAGAQAKEVE